MRLYHWTRVESVSAILRNGWRNSSYQSETGMVLGVWFSEHSGQWAAGNTALLAVEFADGELEESWRSSLIPTDWQIPSEFLLGKRVERVAPA